MLLNEARINSLNSRSTLVEKTVVMVGLYLHSTDQDAQKFSFFVKFITIFSYQARLNCELCFILWGGGRGGRNYVIGGKVARRMNLLNKKRSLIPSGLRMPSSKINSFRGFSWLSVVLACSRERPQIVMLRVEWFGK